MAKKIQTKVIVAGVALGVLGAGAALAYIVRHDVMRTIERAALPEAMPYQPAEPIAAAPAKPAAAPSRLPSTTPAAESTLPAEVNLAVPFTPQAPHGRWDLPYKEFCEEASVLMAVSYLRGQPIGNADAAAEKMHAIQAFEEERFGYYEDTTAAETAVILREHYDLDSVQLLENPAVDDLKGALAAGKLIIMPAAGRSLGNPYYTPPGPLYHMLVIKGYTADGRFITNDPGTRRGADFLYPAATVMNALHDWRTDGQVELGRKVVLIVG